MSAEQARLCKFYFISKCFAFEFALGEKFVYIVWVLPTQGISTESFPTVVISPTFESGADGELALSVIGQTVIPIPTFRSVVPENPVEIFPSITDGVLGPFRLAVGILSADK